MQATCPSPLPHKARWFDAGSITHFSVSFDQRGMGIGGEGIRERIARAIGIGGGQINLGKMFCDTCMSSSPSQLSHLIHRLHLPFWASNTRIGLRQSLGPWAGCIWNQCSTTRANNTLLPLRSDLSPSRSHREALTQCLQVSPSCQRRWKTRPLDETLQHRTLTCRNAALENVLWNRHTSRNRRQR